MNYSQTPFKIYVHCPNDCGCHRSARSFLHSWGLEATLQFDGDHYLEFTIPQDWSQERIKRFCDALNTNLRTVEVTDNRND